MEDCVKKMIGRKPNRRQDIGNPPTLGENTGIELR